MKHSEITEEIYEAGMDGVFFEAVREYRRLQVERDLDRYEAAKQAFHRKVVLIRDAVGLHEDTIVDTIRREA